MTARFGEAKLGVDLYWLPLGAGGHSVRLNGRVFEAIAARVGRRDRRDLYHSALVVRVPMAAYIIEQGPAWQDLPADRGVVAEGAVGARAAGRFKLFRYEIRCWRDGILPDIGEAVESPQRLAEDAAAAERVLHVIQTVPAPVWGRDELQNRGDVEFELGHLVAHRSKRVERRRGATAHTRSGARLGRGRCLCASGPRS